MPLKILQASHIDFLNHRKAARKITLEEEEFDASTATSIYGLLCEMLLIMERSAAKHQRDHSISIKHNILLIAIEREFLPIKHYVKHFARDCSRVFILKILMVEKKIKIFCIDINLYPPPAYLKP